MVYGCVLRFACNAVFNQDALRLHAALLVGVKVVCMHEVGFGTLCQVNILSMLSFRKGDTTSARWKAARIQALSWFAIYRYANFPSHVLCR